MLEKSAIYGYFFAILNEWFKVANPNKVKSRRSLWLDCGILLSFMSEQVMGVEPTLPAWEAGVLPIYDTCKAFIFN